MNTYHKSEGSSTTEYSGIIIIGAGQAGLSVAYYLQKRKSHFLVLDANKNIGDSWRNRWDFLKLFTPAQYNRLPGYPFPAARGSFPSKDDMANYIVAYVNKFKLPVRTDMKVSSVRQTKKGYEISTQREVFYCKQLVIATGANPVPKIPELSKKLHGNIFQLHSAYYRNEKDLAPGNVLVVGAGASGVQLAIELSKSRETFIAGNPTFHIPDFVFRYVGRLYWFFAKYIVTLHTPLGRKVKPKFLSGGGPLINVSVKDLEAAGVNRLPKLNAVENGIPVFENKANRTFSNVLWATGFKPDFSWIHINVFDKSGWPITDRGTCSAHEGLYFIGMPFQFGLSSTFVGGVGRDAKYIVKQLLREQQRMNQS